MLESDDPFNLRRFTDQQRTSYSVALNEIRAGQKKSHWIWFIFPTPPHVQNGVEGGSPKNQFYAIRSEEEASAFLRFHEDGVNLRENYLEVTRAVHQQLKLGTALEVLFGEVDGPKLQSSLRFFHRIAAQSKDAELQQACEECMELLGKGFPCSACSLCSLQ